jgi:hypothetical protein
MGAALGDYCDGESYILVDWDGFEIMSFYLRNQMFYGPINRTNYRMMETNPRARYMLMTYPSVEPSKQRFGIGLFAYARLRDENMRGAGSQPGFYLERPLGNLLDIRGVKRFEFPDDKIGAPRIEGVNIGEREIKVNWSHPAPERVGHYRVYWRSDDRPFYFLCKDVEGEDVTLENYAGERLRVVVVAVDGNGEESEFDREIKGWRDGE